MEGIKKQVTGKGVTGQQPSLFSSLAAKSKEMLAPYQMGEPSNKVHQIYSAADTQPSNLYKALGR